ncbi:hypothetical protein HYC85_029951, partial [Camellia sinensis]
WPLSPGSCYRETQSEVSANHSNLVFPLILLLFPNSSKAYIPSFPDNSNSIPTNSVMKILGPCPPPPNYEPEDSAISLAATLNLDNRVPATIITGFLGYGKFGEVDIDGSLVASHSSANEEIIMVNNGCLCCTVHGDLVKMLLELVKKKREKFDHVVIETTGLEKPAPVIETFCTDDLVSHYVKLDGVVTLVDSKHVMQRLNEVKPRFVVNEAVEQIAYADRIILNKIDLVTEAELESLTNRIKHINGMAQIKLAKYGVVDMDFVLGVGGYDLERIDSEVQLDSSPCATHQHDSGHADLIGRLQQQTGASPSQQIPPPLRVPIPEETPNARNVQEDTDIPTGPAPPPIPPQQSKATTPINVSDSPFESEIDPMTLKMHKLEKLFKKSQEHHKGHHHDHKHDSAVSSVNIVSEDTLNLDEVDDWLERIIEEKGDDLYKMKGVLSMNGSDERYVFQGVQSIFDGCPGKAWGPDEKRINKLVFIGRNLDETALRKGFKGCVV